MQKLYLSVGFKMLEKVSFALRPIFTKVYGEISRNDDLPARRVIDREALARAGRLSNKWHYRQ
jgi:hypothetical protein